MGCSDFKKITGHGMMDGVQQGYGKKKHYDISKERLEQALGRGWMKGKLSPYECCTSSPRPLCRSITASACRSYAAIVPFETTSCESQHEGKSVSGFAAKSGGYKMCHWTTPFVKARTQAHGQRS